jgi:bacterioferritin
MTMAMKTKDQEIIDLLNDVLCGELTAINQYFLHSKLCLHWGYDVLAKVTRAQSIGEMKHAEILAERILYLGGIPNLQKLGKIFVGETVLEQMELDKKLEFDAIERLNKGISLCTEHQDNGTRVMLEAVLTSEEEHYDWLDKQIQLIKNLGEANYLSQKISEEAPA